MSELVVVPAPTSVPLPAAATDARNGQVALADFAVRALQAGSVDEVIENGCSLLRELCGFDTVGVLRYHAPERTFVGDPGAPHWHDPRVEVPDILTRTPGLVRHTGEPFVYCDATRETRVDTTVLLARNLLSGIVALIGSHNDPYGVVSAHCHRVREYTDGDVAVVRTIGSIVAAAVARHRAEGELKATRAVYEAVANSAQEGIVTADSEGVLQFVNPRLATMLGGQPDDFKGRDILELVVDEDKPIALKRREARRRGQSSRYDVRLRALDGRVIWTSITGNPLRDRHGNVIGAMGIISDITHRVMAAELLQHQKTQLAEAQALAHVGSWDADLERGTVAWSDEMYRIVGLEPQSRPITLEFARTLLPPDDRHAAEVLDSAVLNGEELDLVHRLRRVDGGIRWVHSIGRATNDPINGHRKYIATTLDITAQKNADDAREELSRHLMAAAADWKGTFDSIQTPIVILDAAERLSRLNTAALHLTQFDNHRDAIGTAAIDAGSHALWPVLVTLRRECVEERRVISRRIATADGKTWDVLASPWDEAAAPRTTLVATDVTSLARMEEHLRRSERMSAVGALVAGVVHEVRNPLFGISATLDAMEAIGCQCAASRFGTALRQQVVRMKELTHDLLEYGRPVPPEFRLCDLSGVLVHARTSSMPLAVHAGVKIKIRCEPALQPIRMDAQRVLQVFENLVRNAIQHAPRESAVELSARMEDGFACVTVSDRGPGIATADLPHIFEPFYTKSRGGTGLGLSLAQRIVDEHDGTIAAAPRAGGGTSMTVRLPIGGSV